MECNATNGFNRQQVNLYMNEFMRLPVLRQPLPARGARRFHQVSRDHWKR